MRRQTRSKYFQKGNGVDGYNDIITLAGSAQGTVVEYAPVARLASTVVPTGHVDTDGSVVAAVQICGTFIQVLLAVGTLITSSAGTDTGTDAFATV